MKNIVSKLRRQYQPKHLAKVYFEEHGLLCDQCNAVGSLDGLQPLTFAPCGKCGFQNFVPLQVEDYLLFQPIGAGSIASVYKAYHREFLETVLAVKVLKPEHLGNEEVISAFLAECEMHSLVTQHPNVAGYIDGGLLDAVYFHAMDFADGERLMRRVERRGKIEERETLDIVFQILNALEHIETCGVLYRDLNASNIIVKENGVAVLVDFGLALTLEEALAAKTRDHIWGTGEFMPIERIYGKGEDAASMIYSMGLLVYYLLTAEMLIKSSTAQGYAKRHVSAVRLALTPDRFPGCSEETMELITAMIQPHHDDRYQTFAEAAEAVRQVVQALDRDTENNAEA